MMPRRSRPFPIILTGIAGPKASLPAPRNERNFVQCEITPLYVGRSTTSRIRYANCGEGLAVGGLVEPFGFGARPCGADSSNLSQDIGRDRTLGQASFAEMGEANTQQPHAS